MKLEKLRKQISEDIVNSHLEVDCIYYVLKDIFREIEDTYYLYLNQNKEGETK